jgi:hypothetical protein
MSVSHFLRQLPYHGVKCASMGITIDFMDEVTGNKRRNLKCRPQISYDIYPVLVSLNIPPYHNDLTCHTPHSSAVFCCHRLCRLITTAQTSLSTFLTATISQTESQQPVKTGTSRSTRSFESLRPFTAAARNALTDFHLPEIALFSRTATPQSNVVLSTKVKQQTQLLVRGSPLDQFYAERALFRARYVSIDLILFHW